MLSLFNMIFNPPLILALFLSLAADRLLNWKLRIDNLQLIERLERVVKARALDIAPRLIVVLHNLCGLQQLLQVHHKLFLVQSQADKRLEARVLISGRVVAMRSLNSVDSIEQRLLYCYMLAADYVQVEGLCQLVGC